MAVFNLQRAKSLAPSYLVDWGVVVVMAVVWFLVDLVHPFRRLFSIDDETLMYSYTVHETVPTYALALISFVLPLTMITAVSLTIRRSSWDWHQGVLGLCLTMVLTLAITHTLKVSVGRLRPDFIDRCQPRPGTVNPSHGLLNMEDVCTQTDESIMRDGSKSFPSGHSSESFAGMTYLALYFAGKLFIFDRQGRAIKGFIVLVPLLLAALVAVSRVDDYRHHWQDVTVGALIGIFCAYFSYRQLYPPLYDIECAKPFPVREMSAESLENEAATRYHHPQEENHDLTHVPSPASASVTEGDWHNTTAGGAQKRHLGPGEV